MTSILSFDRAEIVETNLLRPDRFRQLFCQLSKPRTISRGAGLNYCNAGAVTGGNTVLSTLFNRFLAFDIERGTVRVEPGVTFGDLFKFSTTHNLFPPVLPGYPLITVGGALAMNIHGKNQFQVGNFANHVRRLTLYHPRYGELSCTPDENQELFWLTTGGFGLTGHLLSVDLALSPLRGGSLAIERHKVGDLYEATQLMYALAKNADYLYSWHDLTRTDKKFGCGTVYLERFSNVSPHARADISPTDKGFKPLPWPIFNRLTIPMFCRSYDLKECMAPRHEIEDLYSATFPIVGKEMYFRLFGRRGFREYQAVFPKESWEKAVKSIEDVVKTAGVPIALASLKLFEGKKSFLNFSGEGICLALDMPNTTKSIEFFSRLDEITINARGIANIAKDSRLSADAVRRMYGNGYDQFRSILRAYDPDAHFQSELRRRLDV